MTYDDMWRVWFQPENLTFNALIRVCSGFLLFRLIPGMDKHSPSTAALPEPAFQVCQRDTGKKFHSQDLWQARHGTWHSESDKMRQMHLEPIRTIYTFRFLTFGLSDYLAKPLVVVVRNGTLQSF